MYDNNKKLIKQAQEKNNEAMDYLVKNNSGLIWNIVRRFLGRGYDSEDLYQIGCIGLIKAIQRFDITLDVQLSTYAVPYIIGEIKRYIRDDGIIKVSRQTKELAAKVIQIQKEYLSKTGEEINISQIAKILNVSKVEVASAIDSINVVNSIDSIENEDSDSRSLIETISDDKDEYSRLINKLTINEIINNLEDREKKVVLLRYYKEQTQSQVGKILGITQVQVSRIEKKVLEKMKCKLEAV